MTSSTDNPGLLLHGLSSRRKKSLGVDEKKRGKRLFGGLLSTLDAFKVRFNYSQPEIAG